MYSKWIVKDCRKIVEILLVMVLNKMSSNYIFSKNIWKSLKVIEIYNYVLKCILNDWRNIVSNGVK